MLLKKASDIPSSEITDKKLYLRRREFIQAAAVGAVGAAAGTLGAGMAEAATWPRVPIPNVQKPSSPALTTTEKPNSYQDIATYNNFYEFGTDKGDPSQNAGGLRTKPWTVKVEGMVTKPGDYHLEDLIKPYALEDRVYRHRCVERWSLVIPWVGFPLASLLKTIGPTSTAKFVEFTTLLDAHQMPGQRTDVLRWPYVEGLRLDEAMHPLTLLAVGMYGEFLPNQNGAPVRLVIPWKYGFKSIKSLVKIKLVEKQPPSTWQLAIPNEYGFYSNVNPLVDHPRWSQATERRLGEFFKRKTLMFNGYEKEVASLYSGMDLKKYY